MCEEDWTPLTDAYLNDPPQPLETASKIPKSLLIVTYLFFIQSSLYFLGAALLICGGVQAVGAPVRWFISGFASSC